MTDTPDTELPERLDLDPFSRAVLAVNAELERQLPADATVVIDPTAVTRAALDAGGGVPRIPTWDGQSRTIGGRTVGGSADTPEPEVTVFAATDAGEGEVGFHVVLGVDGTDRVLPMSVAATDAEQWFLAGLAAVRAARAAAHTTGP